MNATRVSYTLDSTLASVNKAEQAATEVAAKSGFDEDDCGRIAMAVREAAVNAVLHGNHYEPNKRVTVSFESTSDALTVAVRDEGPGLDPATLPDPLSPENLLKQSGRGIFLIRAFMDEVNFRTLSPGTEITMIKYVRGVDRGGNKEANQ
jgi:serine/threonine-protein kinase RsbW